MVRRAKIWFIFFAITFFLGSLVMANSIEKRPEEKVPILVYHNIMDHYDPQSSLVHISPVEFENHMISIRDAGFNTITFTDYYNYVVHGKPLPEKHIIITFDDGYYSNYEYAYPILKRLNMKATIFVITGRMGDKEVTFPHFGWEEAREMQSSGVIDIQSHSNLHPVMTNLEEGRLQLELRRSKYLIEKELGKPCEVFAYPYGMLNAYTQTAAQKAGYKIQVKVGDKGVNTANDGLMQLKRLTARGGTSGQELLDMIYQNLNEDVE